MHQYLLKRKNTFSINFLDTYQLLELPQLDWINDVQMVAATNYGHTKAKSQILCSPNSNPTHK
jgi:hypothetical protein